MSGAPPRAMGNVVPLGDGATEHVPLGSPPTSYAAYGVVTGQPGAILRMTAFTLLRSLILAPGLAIAGIRGRTLILSSVAGSVTMTSYALGCALYSKWKSGPETVGPLPTIDPPITAEADEEEIPDGMAS